MQTSRLEAGEHPERRVAGSRVRMRPPGVLLAHERGAMLLQSLRRAPAGAGATHGMSIAATTKRARGRPRFG